MKNTVDLKDLKEQRDTLNILLTYPEEFFLSKERIEHLTGIQNLLDFINDNLEDHKTCTLIPVHKPTNDSTRYSYYKNKKGLCLRIISKPVQYTPLAYLGEYASIPNELRIFTPDQLNRSFKPTTEAEFYKHKKE